MAGPHVCSECGRSYPRKDKLKFHEKHQHALMPTEKAFQCPECPHKCHYQYELNTHIKRVHRKKFACQAPRELIALGWPKCSCSFGRLSQLWHHVCVAHKSVGDKRYMRAMMMLETDHVDATKLAEVVAEAAPESRIKAVRPVTPMSSVFTDALSDVDDSELVDELAQTECTEVAQTECTKTGTAPPPTLSLGDNLPPSGNVSGLGSCNESLQSVPDEGSVAWQSEIGDEDVVASAQAGAMEYLFDVGCETKGAICPFDSCNDVFATKLTWFRHLRKHLNPPHTCEVCCAPFISFRKLFEHWKDPEVACERPKQGRRRPALMQPTLWKCDTCTKVYRSKGSYMKHVEVAHQGSPVRYKCAYCDYETPYPTTYARHMNTEERRRREQPAEDHALWQSVPVRQEPSEDPEFREVIQRTISDELTPVSKRLRMDDCSPSTTMDDVEDITCGSGSLPLDNT